MKPFIKIILFYGLILWLIPFIVGFIAFPLKSFYSPVFETVMGITLTVCAVVFAILYFRKLQGDYLKQGIIVGLIWFAMSVLIDLPPAQTERVVRDAYAAGIRRVWMQQGAESDAAIAFCDEHRMSVVFGECILMFSEPAQFFHRAHRWVKGAAGQLPR